MQKYRTYLYASGYFEPFPIPLMICPYPTYNSHKWIPGAIPCCSMFSWVQSIQNGSCESIHMMWFQPVALVFQWFIPLNSSLSTLLSVFLLLFFSDETEKKINLPCASNDDELIFLVGGRASCRYPFPTTCFNGPTVFLTPGCSLQFLGKSMNLFNFGVENQ